jgi:hypothetical protein
MLIVALKQSIASHRALSKSHHARRFKESTAANAHAVDMPVKKSAEVVRNMFLTTFRLIPLL